MKRIIIYALLATSPAYGEHHHKLKKMATVVAIAGATAAVCAATHSGTVHTDANVHQPQVLRPR